MGATLLVADERNAYTLSDIATFLVFRERIRLVWRDGRCAEVRFGGGAPYRRL